MEKSDPFVSEWISFSKNPNHNLIEKCLKMAQILEYPELNLSEYIEKINEMGDSLKLKIGEVKNPTYLISVLNEYFFDELGFHGAEEDYYDPGNSFLNVVLDKKTGIPITLSILYSEVVKHIGLDLQICWIPWTCNCKIQKRDNFGSILSWKIAYDYGIKRNFE